MGIFSIEIGQVYEVPLSRFHNGLSVLFEAGDLLQVSASAAKDIGIQLYGVEGSSMIPYAQIKRVLQVTMMEGPAFEPPPARYDALMALGGSVAAPLQAQSPLPARVEIHDAARGFRRGMIERVATFVWTLMRPSSEKEKMRVYVVKGDRNGQTSIPEIQT